MVRTVRDALVTAMEDLCEGSFKKFRNKLNDWSIEGGFNKIPKGKLEKADTEDMADLIRNYYKEDYGARLTLEVLEAINERPVADDLRENLAKVTGSGSTEKPKAPESTSGDKEECPSSSSPAQPNKVHFVDKHREPLIQRNTDVAGVLDILMGKNLLTDEQYDRIRNEGTSQDKMRELYRCMRGWGMADKDVLLQALKEKNGPLVRDLERS